MAWRTPSSLKWLITKRSRISGVLLNLEAEKARLLRRLATVEGRTATLAKQLVALDQTFELHEIQMEPTEIRPVLAKMRQRLMPHGQLGRAILGELRRADDWLSSTEVLARVANRVNPEDSDYVQIRKCVRRRLGKLARDGLVERQASFLANGKHDETLWRIAARRPHAERSVLLPAKEIVETQFTPSTPPLPIASPPPGHRGSHEAGQE